VKYERSQHIQDTETLTEIQTFRAWGQRSRTEGEWWGQLRPPGCNTYALKCKQTFATMCVFTQSTYEWLPQL